MKKLKAFLKFLKEMHTECETFIGVSNLQEM